jgi:hypothetical protein
MDFMTRRKNRSSLKDLIFTNAMNHHNITEILLKVALNTINQPTNVMGLMQLDI